MCEDRLRASICLFNCSRYRYRTSTVLGHSSGVNISLQLWGICKIVGHEHLACSVFESPWFRGKLASEFDTSTPQLLTHYRVYCSKLISCSKISRFRRSPTRMHIRLEIVKADWSYFIYHTCHLPVTTVWAAIATQSQFHSRSKTLTQGVPFGGLVKTDLVWYRYGCFMDIFFITGLSYLTEQRGWRTAPCPTVWPRWWAAAWRMVFSWPSVSGQRTNLTLSSELSRNGGQAHQFLEIFIDKVLWRIGI